MGENEKPRTASFTDVEKMLARLSRWYPGKIALSEEMTADWYKLLCDVDPDCMFAAAADLVSTSISDWPPTIGAIRSRALELAAGELAPVSAYEAWERVRKVPHDDTVVLRDIEKAALSQIGGTWELQNGSGATIYHFVRAYDALLIKQRRIRTVLPVVASVAETNAPALPDPVNTKPLELTDGGHETGADPSEVSELLKGLENYEPVRG